MEKKITTIVLCFIFVSFGLSAVSRAEDLGSVFSYQGRLETAGSEPLSGSYDFKFRVYDTLVGANTPIGEIMEEPNVPVTEGIFTVRLNPDPNGTAPNLFNGEVRYLEIAVRKTGSAESYFTISPRQRIHAAPYAITASSARWLRGRNSTEKVVYVDDAGNVGVGTTSPSQKLDIVGSATVSGNVGIGTTSPTEELEVNGTVKADSFNGVPWRSPAWYILNADAGDIGYLVSAWWDSAYCAKNYRVPFRVTIEGAVVSSSGGDADDTISIELWTGTKPSSLYNRKYTNTATFSDDFDARKVSFTSGSYDVPANYLITVKCHASVEGSPDVQVWLYGRINE